MLLAQVAIPAAIAVALLLAAWSWLRLSPARETPPSLAAISGTIAESAVAYLHRQYPTIAVLSLLLALFAGAALGLFRESVEDGALLGGSVLAGAAGAAIAAYLATRASLRANLRASSPPSSAAHTAGAVAALLPGLIALAVVAGLYALYSRVLDNPVEPAALLTAGAALGAGFVAIFARPGAALFAAATESGATAASTPEHSVPSGDPRNAASIAALGGRNLVASHASGLFEVTTALLAAAMLLGATIAAITGDIEWLLLPPVLSAAGLLVAGVVLALGPLSARAGNVTVSALASALLNLAAIAAVTLTLIDDDWYWFAGAGAFGVAATILQSLLARRLSTASVPRALEAAAFGALVVAAVLVAGYSLGTQAEVAGVSSTLTGWMGVAIAATGALMSLLALAGLPAASAVAANASTILATSHDSTPEARQAASSAASRAQSAASATHASMPVVAILAAVLLFIAFLTAVRQEFGSIAHTDPDRYAAMAQDVDLIPPGEDTRLLEAIALEDFVERIRASAPNLDIDWQEDLLLAGFEETIARLDTLVADGDLTAAEADRIGRTGSPLALPSVPPLPLARPEVLVGTLVGAVLVLLFHSLLLRALAGSTATVAAEVRRQFAEDPGIITGDVRPDYAAAADLAVRSAFGRLALAVLLALAVPLAVGLGFRWAYGGDGNQGWLALGAAAVAAIVTSALVACLSPAAENGRDSRIAASLASLALFVPSFALVLAPYLL